MAPDLVNHPGAAASWNKIRNGIIAIMINSQKRSKQMFEAVMKIKVVDNSV
jgi:hypothetical protein